MSGNDGGRRGGDDRPDPSSDAKETPQGKERLPEDAKKLGYGSDMREPVEEEPEHYRPTPDTH